MNDLIIKEDIKIEDLIYEVRGKQVMLDSDLAKLYNCKNGTKEINQSVKRNMVRFPEDFYFQLTKEEYYAILRSQFVTLDLKQGKYTKYLPYVFTEQGVAMLASILKTNVASKISVQIMRAFVAMKKYINNNIIEQKYINNMVLKHDNDIRLLQESFNKMSEKVKNDHLFYDGQIYDAYSLMLDIFNLSKKSITIIDNYIDKNLLDILSKINKKILVITNKYNEIDFSKYKEEYDNVIIIDNVTLYHCESSFKDLGLKCFAITKIEDKEILGKIIGYIKD